MSDREDAQDANVKKLAANEGVTQSADILADNIEHLKSLFPEAFTEGKIDFAILKQLLGGSVDEREEKYGLNWHGKRRARQLALTPSTGTLRPCLGESVDWDATQNLMIEGDNLEVLKLLQKSYANAVKLIYIDPPYNTGNEFIYSDRFEDNLTTYLRYTGQVNDEGLRSSTNTEASGRFHTNWLNMMYPRLKLARNLLRLNGVIVISIDDHEVQNLRSLMDDVFGPENFVATVIWQKVYAPKNSARHFSDDHDYLVIYARSAETWQPELLPRTAEQDAHYSNPDNDPRGAWRADGMSARNYYSKGTYRILTPGGRVIDGPPSGRYWVYSEDKFKELDSDKRIWWGENGNNQPAVKRFLSEVSNGRVPQTLWTYEQVGHTQEAKKELLNRIEFESSDSVFDTPKPRRLLQQVIRIATRDREGDIVMDFFAGSGSTGDAVMQLNTTDGGNRRFVLVQLPERTGANDYPTIAEITKARLRAASKAINGKDQETFNGTSGSSNRIDLGFRVFKLDSSNIRSWEAVREEFLQTLKNSVEHLKPDRSEEDILYELLLKLGLDLCIPMQTHSIAGMEIHAVGGGVLFACLAGTIALKDVEPLAQSIVEWHKALAPAGDTTCVFRDSAFADDVAKTNLAAILYQHGLTNVRSL